MSPSMQFPSPNNPFDVNNPLNGMTIPAFNLAFPTYMNGNELDMKLPSFDMNAIPSMRSMNELSLKSIPNLNKSNYPVFHKRQKDSIFFCDFPECGLSFTRMQNLKSHQRCHLEESPHSCNICFNKFKRHTDLQRHIRSKHASEDEKPWGCTGCSRRFGRADALKRHLASRSSKVGCPANFTNEHGSMPY